MVGLANNLFLRLGCNLSPAAWMCSSSQSSIDERLPVLLRLALLGAKYWGLAEVKLRVPVSGPTC